MFTLKSSEKDAGKVNDHLLFLGRKVQDRVTGFAGVVTSVSFDLYGCIQVVVTPPAGDDGKCEDSRWHDINRLQVVDSSPVMERPDFVAGPVAEGKKGPADKPAPSH